MVKNSPSLANLTQLEQLAIQYAGIQVLNKPEATLSELSSHFSSALLQKQYQKAIQTAWQVSLHYSPVGFVLYGVVQARVLAEQQQSGELIQYEAFNTLVLLALAENKLQASQLAEQSPTERGWQDQLASTRKELVDLAHFSSEDIAEAAWVASQLTPLDPLFNTPVLQRNKRQLPSDKAQLLTEIKAWDLNARSTRPSIPHLRLLVGIEQQQRLLSGRSFDCELRI